VRDSLRPPTCAPPLERANLKHLAEGAEKEVSAEVGSGAPGALAGLPCPACSSPDVRILFEVRDRLNAASSDEYRIVECARCRLMRLDPCPGTPATLDHPSNRQEGDSLADRLERVHRRLALSDRVHFILRVIEQAGDGGLVVDVSSEGDSLRRALAEHGLHVIGLNLFTQAAGAGPKPEGGKAGLSAGRDKPEVCPTVRASLLAAPLAPESCRAIVMLHVLEHLDNPSGFIEAACALLRPGGRLVVLAPNAGCWQFLLMGENWSGLDVPRHRIDFRASDLEALLESAGFEVRRRKHFAPFDNPAALAMSLAPNLAPSVRRARGVLEGPAMKLAKHLLWYGLMAAVLPFTVLESACRAGSTVMIEARKKA